MTATCFPCSAVARGTLLITSARVTKGDSRNAEVSLACGGVRPSSCRQWRAASHNIRAFDGLPPRGGVRKEILACGHGVETEEQGTTHYKRTNT